MTDHYHACPAHRCNAPGRAFLTHLEALRWAREVALRHRVTVTVWKAQRGRLQLLTTVNAPEGRRADA
jgi:hypothetical protein